MRLDGTMTVGALGLAGMQFADVGARIVIGDGNLALENARARLYGGRFDGSFRVRAAGDAPGLALTGKATDLELASLIEALTGGPANVSGTGNFDIDLAGRGRKIIDNVGTAAGNVRFGMSDGTLKGFNLGRSLCSAWNVKERAPGPPERPDETRYEVIQGTATVQGGVATTRDLLARTSFMDITGGGTLVLTEQRLDYEVDAKLTGNIDIPNCATMDELVGSSIPFTIKGPVDGPPTILPDFSKIVRRVIQEKIQERVQDAVRDRIRDLLN
jgi:AsmA protein